MGNEEVLSKSIACVTDGRALIDSLDNSPSFVRKTDHAQQARRTAVAAIELIGELVNRVRADMCATGQSGGDCVNKK